MTAVAARKSDAARALLAGHPAPADEARWAEEARARARDALVAQGAPAPRDEYWRYTDPAPFIGTELPGVFEGTAIMPVLDALTLTFIDGVLTGLPPAGEGLTIEPLAAALGTDLHWARSVFGVLEGEGQSPVPRPLAAFGTAAARNGVALRVTGPVARPVHLQYSGTGPALMHHLLRIEAGGSLTLIESGAAGRGTIVLEADMAGDAALDHLRLQGPEGARIWATHLFARLGAKARLKSCTLSAQGRTTRNETVVTLAGPGAVAHIAGARIGAGETHQDDTLFVTHAAPGCESRQVFKSVLRGGSVGVFQGKILVRQAAQKTDGYQISQGLLLDEDSQFLAKPELEIYADDVKCSHGSTVGAVDETALFYLMSRGVDRDTAEGLLVLAFLDAPLAEIADPVLADELRAVLADWAGARD